MSLATMCWAAGQYGVPAAVRITEAGHVIEQGVKPNVGHVVVIKGKRNAPCQTGFRTGYTQVLERLPQEGQHLVSIPLRPDEVRVLRDMIDQPLLISAHPEKIIGLSNDFRYGLMIRAFTVHQLSIRIEPLASETVSPLVFAEINIARVVNCSGSAGPPRCGRVRGPDEVVVPDVHIRPQGAELPADVVHVSPGTHPFLSPPARSCRHVRRFRSERTCPPAASCETDR